MQTTDRSASKDGSAQQKTSFGVVVIGRNEGDRLRASFESLIPMTPKIVYVDSGSTDGSMALARHMNIAAVALDMSIKFTAARARNRGFERLRQLWPDVTSVQFVDGDCVVLDAWLPTAAAYLEANPKVVCVSGRLRERFPEHSVYNRLCDAEWDRPVGETTACGGIAMMNAASFELVGGFRDDVAAGEEAELCARLRANGGVIWRLATPMALHDAAMYRFDQWWLRCKRSGFGTASNLFSKLSADRGSEIRSLLRPWLWCIALPVAAALGHTLFGPFSLLVLFLYPIQVFRSAVSARGTWQTRMQRGFFLLLSKLAELTGQLEYWRSARSKTAATSFDYKS